MAGWPSSTFVMPAASSRSSSTTPRWPTRCATSSASRSIGTVVEPARGQREPGPADRRRSRSWSRSSRCCPTAAPLPFPIDDRVTVGEETRLRHRYLDLRRKSAGDAIRMRSKVNQICRDVLLAQEFLEIETPTLTRSTPEGARDFLVPVPAAARALVRPAPVAAAVQAAADGGRHGALLPDRPLLPRRGLPRRPPAGVHPARHRDVLRRAGRRDRRGRGRGPRTLAGRAGRRHRRGAAHDLRRGDAPLRLRQARPAIRPRARRRHGLLRRHPVPRVPGGACRRGGHARRRGPAAQAVRRAGRSGPSSAGPRAWPT